jgi:hypothetical protein
MAEFDSSITAYIGGDYSGLTEAVTGAEGEIKNLDAKFATLGANMTKVPQAFADENKKAMEQILSGEERLAAYRDKTAFSRMTDEQKLGVLRADGMKILDRISAIEGESVEKTALQLQFEKKKTEIYDLNNKVTADGLITQKEATKETGDHKEKATGLSGVVESLKKGFKDMGVSIQGAGIGIAFATFISLGKEAINNAQKQRDEWEKMGKPLDASTASLARLGDTIDSAKKGAVAAVGAVIGFVTQTGEWWGSAINRMQGVTAEQEKIAAESQRAADAMQKRADATRAEKMDVDKLHAAHVALNESNKAYAESKMTAEQRHNALLADAIELTRKINVDKKAGLDPVEWETKLLEKQKEIRGSNLGLIESESAQRIAAINASAALETTHEGKMRAVKSERIVLEDTLRKTIEATGRTSEQTRGVELRLQENIGKELQMQRELIQKQGEDRAKMTLDGREYEKLLQLQAKSALGLTKVERDQLEILTLKTKEKELQFKIDDMIAKRRTQTGAEVSAEEDKTLAAIIQQRDKIAEQIGLKSNLANVTKNAQLPAEKEITEEKEKQAVIDARAAEAARYAAALTRHEAATKSLGISVKSDFSQYSTAELQGFVQKARQKADDLVNPALNYQRGGPVVYLDRLESGRLNVEANSAQKELDLRKEIQDYGRRMGDVATIMKYGDAQTDRAFRAFTVGADKTNTILERLSRQLTSTGIFNAV